MNHPPLRVLQIGAGSMGGRRLRDLSPRQDVNLALLEARHDRRTKAAARHSGLVVFDNLPTALEWKPQALCVSTPPDQHDDYVKLALEWGLHHFCEANIWTMNPALVDEISQRKGLVSAPSCSLHFLPVVEELSRIVRHELGSLHGYQMALNTYMPDWHPGEGPEYYARNRNTAAGREMVPFELLWLNNTFGAPSAIAGSVTRGGTLEGVVEDTWSLQLQLSSGASGQLMVLMACPAALRQGWCFGQAGQVFFDLFSGEIRRDYRNGICDSRNFGAMKDVLESTYQRETVAFIDAVQGKTKWPLGYHAAAVATAALAAAEASAAAGRTMPVDVLVQPVIYQS
jgi:predicted dehydrogenase